MRKLAELASFGKCLILLRLFADQAGNDHSTVVVEIELPVTFMVCPISSRLPLI